MEIKEHYPAEWHDDKKMDVLFSPFRENRDINPASWDRKMKFWTDLIVEECRHSKELVFNPKYIAQKFRRKEKQPVCLEKVLQEMLRQGKIQRVSEFQANVNEGWLSWGFGLLVKKPVWWTFNKVLGNECNSQQVGDFVITEVVQKRAEDVYQRHWELVRQGNSQPVVEWSQLANQLLEICPDEASLHLVITQLQKDKKVSIVMTEKKEKLVKFVEPNEKETGPVGDADIRMFRLQKTVQDLEQQVSQLSEEIERCVKDAKYYLSKGLRTSAKNALRRKRHLQKQQERKEQALDTMHGLIHNIQNAESDKMIMDAYAAGTAAFKEKVTEGGLTTDNIDDIMIGLQEVTGIRDEYNSAMAQGPEDSFLDATAMDLEKELEEILAEDESQDQDLSGAMNDLSLQDIQLPSVPTFDPGTPPSAAATKPAVSSAGAQSPMYASMTTNSPSGSQQYTQAQGFGTGRVLQQDF